MTHSNTVAGNPSLLASRISLLMLDALVEGSEMEKDSDAVAILVPRPLKMHHSFKTDVECSATRKRSIVPKQVTGVPDPVFNQVPT